MDKATLSKLCTLTHCMKIMHADEKLPRKGVCLGYVNYLEILGPHLCIFGTVKDINFLGNVTHFQREPRQRGCQIHGVGKLCDFRLISPFT